MDKVFFLINGVGSSYKHINCLERGAAYCLPSHSHSDFWQAIVVTDGELKVTSDDSCERLTRGDIHILPCGCTHMLESDGYRQIGIDFTPDDPRLQTVCRSLEHPTILHIPHAMEYARRICELGVDGQDNTELICALCDVILLCAVQTVKRKPDPFRQRLLEFIDENPTVGRLDDVAAAMFVSPSHLERRVRELFGVGAMALVNRRRFERACAELVGTDRAVRDIAESLGFSEMSNFSAFFKRYAGVSPLQYRRRYY